MAPSLSACSYLSTMGFKRYESSSKHESCLTIAVNTATGVLFPMSLRSQKKKAKASRLRSLNRIDHERAGRTGNYLRYIQPGNRIYTHELCFYHTSEKLRSYRHRFDYVKHEGIRVPCNHESDDALFSLQTLDPMTRFLSSILFRSPMVTLGGGSGRPSKNGGSQSIVGDERVTDVI